MCPITCASQVLLCMSPEGLNLKASMQVYCFRPPLFTRRRKSNLKEDFLKFYALALYQVSFEILGGLDTHLDSKDAIIIFLYFLFSHLNGSSVALLVMVWLRRIEVTPIFNHRGMPLSHHLSTLSRPALIPPTIQSLSAPAIDSETFPPNTNPN